MQLLLKGCVLTVPEEDLVQARARIAKSGMWQYGIREPLWREIRITALANEVQLSIGSVNEEAAGGGYCSSWSGCRRISLTWADLNDTEKLKALFINETVGTWELASKLLAETKRAGIVFQRDADF